MDDKRVCHCMHRISSSLLCPCIIHKPGGLLLCLLRPGWRNAVRPGLQCRPFLMRPRAAPESPFSGSPGRAAPWPPTCDFFTAVASGSSLAGSLSSISLSSRSGGCGSDSIVPDAPWRTTPLLLFRRSSAPASGTANGSEQLEEALTFGAVRTPQPRRTSWFAPSLQRTPMLASPDLRGT